MKQELQINRYFDHAMSSGEEQNFLISLAASDDMRIAFRSHLELMKAVRNDKDGLRSVAQVRNRTLTALGLSAAAVTPFIEQELVRNAKPQESAAASPESHLQTASFGGSSEGGLLSGLLRTPKYALGAGIMLGFLSAVTVMNLGPSSNSPQSVAPSLSNPTTQTVAAPTASKPLNSVSTETIPASNGLNTVQANNRAAVASHRSTASRTTAAPNTLAGDNHAATTATPSGTAPEVNVAGKAGMTVHKPTISKPVKDSAEAR